MGPALNDAVGGQVQVIFDNLPTSLELVQSGRLGAMAISAEAGRGAAGHRPSARLGVEDANWMAFFG